MAHYFSSVTDEAIKRYLNATEIQTKHKIFTEEIRPAFEKLVESIIAVYKYQTADDKETMQRDCVSVLYEMLPKFDPERGKKGFSYFNVVARNWFNQKYRERNKSDRLETELLYDLDYEQMKNDPNYSDSPYEDIVVDKEYWISLFQEMEYWRTIVDENEKSVLKKIEKQVLDAIIFLLRNPDILPIYSKKAVFLYIRELTGLNTKQVVMSLKSLKKLYLEFKNNFDSSGENLYG